MNKVFKTMLSNTIGDSGIIVRKICSRKPPKRYVVEHKGLEMAQYNVLEREIEDTVKSFKTKIDFILGMEHEKQKYNDIRRAYRQ